MTNQTLSKIAELNDKLRKSRQGFTMTRAVKSLPLLTLCQLINLVANFNDFDEDNDPWGEHDFGMVSINGESYYWKIDYYDKSMEGGSPNPEDESVTNRVLTLMHSSEY
ncbi:MAG: DUF3768 domain-containing protein [Snowella sp.]|nr:DUF3768 domain-containing protein [Snowella sp.]